MFQASCALKNLRFGLSRTVVNGIWASRVAVPDTIAQTLLNHLSAQPVEATGMVESHMQLRPIVRSALNALCGDVVAHLQAMNLLDPQHAHIVRDKAILMSMRGALPHHDAMVCPSGEHLFWALSLDDTDTDVLFGNIEQRVPQMRGTLVVFDPCQPHAVIAREHDVFMKSHFKKARRQFFAGGEFPTGVWSDVGVQRNLDPSSSHTDILTSLMHSKTCRIKV